MAVLAEALSVIVRRDAVAARFRGGWAAFLDQVPNQTMCCDHTFARVGLMTPTDVGAYTSVLEAGGLAFHKNGQSLDFAVVDQSRGPTLPAPWLEFGVIEAGGIKIYACWLAGQPPGDIAVPDGWTFEGSLSQKPSFDPKGSEEHRRQFLRHENGLDVYLDLVTGKEMFVGRPVVRGDTEAALVTQLQKLCHGALDIDSRSEPFKAQEDSKGAAPLFEELQEQLLPTAERIASGPGVNMAFAHFTRGLILRILHRQADAESAFRKANDLQPGVINTLRELVRSLGEQEKSDEALPFARKAVDVAPDDAGAWGNLAMCLIQRGEREEARRAIDCAINLDPQDEINRHIRDNFEEYFK